MSSMMSAPPPPRLISFLSTLLERLVELNDSELMNKNMSTTTSVFHGLTRPSISIQSYLERIFKYANCSPSCFVVAYVYLDRFSQRQPLLPIDSLNVHRLLITSVMVAAKFMDDLYYNNAYYAKIGGISTAEMNYLEVDFLFGLGFHLNVNPNTFNTYCSHLHREMQIQIQMQMQMLSRQPPLQLVPVIARSRSTPPPSPSTTVTNAVNSTSVIMPKFQSCFSSTNSPPDQDDYDCSSSSSSRSQQQQQQQQHYLAV